MKSKAVRIGKRIMAVMLSLMMVVGVFAGMKLDARAAGKTYWFPKDTSYPNKEKPELTWNTILYEGDIVNFETRQLSNSSIQYMNIKIVWENYRDIHEEMCNIKVEKKETPSITISSLSHDGKTW